MPKYKIRYTNDGIELLVEHNREEYLNHIPEKYVYDLMDKLDKKGDYRTLTELRDLGLLPKIK